MTRAASVLSATFAGSLIGCALAWMATRNPGWVVVGNYGGAAVGAWFAGRRG